MENDRSNCAIDAQEFIDLGCHKIAVGNGRFDMRMWEFEQILRYAQELQPGIELVPIPAIR